MITKADISLVRSLSDRRSRVENGLFVVEGPKMVLEALRSGWNVRAVYGIEDALSSVILSAQHEESQSRTGMRSFALRAQDDAMPVSPRDLERMSSLKTPQGVLAVVEIPTKNTALHTPHPTLALDAVQDPGNLGTIMRTADWFGIRRIMCSPECADRFNSKAVQASMGAIFRVDVSYGELVFPEGYPVFGAFMGGDNIYNVDFPQNAIIVLGNEGRGISPAVAARVTRRVAIPSFDSSPESLNVAAAAAIFCSELFRRQRR